MALKVQGKRLDPTLDSPDSKPLPRKGAPHRGPFKVGHLPMRWDWDDQLGRSSWSSVAGTETTLSWRAG